MNRGVIVSLTNLKKLGRRELMEMLLEVSKENESLRAKVEELEAKVEQRELMLDEAGSIAEASMRINQVFETAEKAAQQYLQNVERLTKQKEAEAEKIRLSALYKAKQIIDKANEYDRNIRAKADQ